MELAKRTRILPVCLIGSLGLWWAVELREKRSSFFESERLTGGSSQFATKGRQNPISASDSPVIGTLKMWHEKFSRSHVKSVDLRNKGWMNHTYGTLDLNALQTAGFSLSRVEMSLVSEFNSSVGRSLAQLGHWESLNGRVVGERDSTNGRITTISMPSNSEAILPVRELLLNAAINIFGKSDGKLIYKSLESCPSFRLFKHDFTIEVTDTGEQIAITAIGNAGRFAVSKTQGTSQRFSQIEISPPSGGGADADRTMFTITQEHESADFDLRWGYLVPK